MFGAWFEGLCLGCSHTILITKISSRITTISSRIYVTFMVKLPKYFTLRTALILPTTTKCSGASTCSMVPSGPYNLYQVYL
jgi:hypothetical protein